MRKNGTHALEGMGFEAHGFQCVGLISVCIL